MKKTNMSIKTKFALADYILIVDAIVDGYFDVTGDYQPHVGIANVMRLFYNNCVIQSKFDSDIPHNFSDLTLVDTLASDADFIKAFNDAISFNSYDLTFANAFYDAQDMIQTKKASYTNVLEGIKTMILSLVSSVQDVMTPENMDTAAQIAKDITNGKIDYSKIMAAFNTSPEFKKIVTGSNKDNVVEFNPVKSE